MTSVAVIHKTEILERLANGEKLKDIADSFGVIKQALSLALVDDPEYQAAIESSMEERLDKREEELEQAPTMLDIARARELLSHARWRAERECPKRWGKDTTIAVQVAPTFTVIMNQGGDTSGGEG